MGCMGFEPGAAGWLAQTKPRSYTGHPLLFQLLWRYFFSMSPLVAAHRPHAVSKVVNKDFYYSPI